MNEWMNEWEKTMKDESTAAANDESTAATATDESNAAGTDESTAWLLLLLTNQLLDC